VLHERRELHVERRRHFADGGWSKKSAVRLHRAPSSSLSLIPPGSVAESLVWRRVAIDTGMALPIHWPPKGLSPLKGLRAVPFARDTALAGS
jgi:hypothetical protein